MIRILSLILGGVFFYSNSFTQNNWLKVRTSNDAPQSHQITSMNNKLYSAESGDGSFVYSSTNGLYNWNQLSSFPDNSWGHTILGYDTTGGGHYYIATNAGEIGGYLYNSQDGNNWTLVSNEGFDNSNEGMTAISSFRCGTDTTTFVYVAKTGVSGAEIWRAPYDNTNPNIWQKVFDFDTINVSNTNINQIIVFQNKLYFCTNNYGDIYSSLDGLVWEKDSIAADGFGNSNSYGFEDLEIYNGNLYVAISNNLDGAELRKFDGSAWTIVFNGGNGDITNVYMPDIHSAEGSLWISIHNNVIQAKVANNQQQSASNTSTILNYTDGVGLTESYYAVDGEVDYYGQFCCLSDVNGYVYALGTKGWSYSNIIRLCLNGTDALDTMNDTTVCAGTSVTFDAGNIGGTYLWEDLTTTTQNYIVGSDGLYNCFVTSPTGCERKISANKYSNPLPPQASVTPSTNEVVCKGNSIALTAYDSEVYRDAVKTNAAGSNFIAPLNYSQIIDETITIEFWVKPNGAGVLLSETEISMSWYDSWLEVEANGNLWGRTWGTPGSNTIGTLNMGQWNHLAMSYDKVGGGDLRFFINGVESPSIQVYDRQAPYESGFYNVNFNFGDGNNTYMYQSNAIDAEYSDIRIWNVPRTQADVAACMDSVFAPATPGLINYYRFLEHTGTTVADSSGSGNTGYFEEGAEWKYNPYYTINWTAHTDIADPSNDSISVTPAISTVYTAHMVDGFGCASSVEVNITVPQADFSPVNPSLCLGDTLVMYSGIFIDGGLWSSTQPFNQIGMDAAEVMPSVSAYYYYGGFSMGCNVNDSVLVTVNTLPMVSAGADLDTCENYLVQLNASGAVSYSWSPATNLDQDNISNPLLTVYAGSIILTGTDANGCVNSDTLTVSTNPTPSVGFEAPYQCQGSVVGFTDHTTISSGSIVSYSWDLGDGATSTNQNPAHPYAAPGWYSITQYATSDLGCVGQHTEPMYSFENPVAAFSSTTECLGTGTVFTDLSTTNDSIVNYSWTFGDGNIDVSNAPVNYYSSAGTFNASLVVFDTFGCLDTAFGSVTVNATPTAFISTSLPCENTEMAFHANESGDVITYSWSFGDGNTSSSAIGINNYGTTGNYTVNVLVTNNFGCSSSAAQGIFIEARPNADYTVANACLGDASNFVDASTISSGTIDQYSWDFGDGQSDNVTNPVHTYQFSGTYSASLIVVSGTGCSDTAFVSQVVHDLPLVSAGADLTVCPGITFGLAATPGYVSYTWEPVSSLSNPSVNNPDCIAFSNVTYTVYATAVTGCVNSDTINIIVDTDVVDASNGVTICYGETTQLNATGVMVYNWIPSTGLSSTTANNPMANPTTHTTYTVQGTTVNGCISYDTVSVWVKALPTISGLVQYDSLGTLIPLVNGTVKVYYADSLGNIVPAASATVTNGVFNFGSVPTGTITLLSIPDSAIYYPNLGMIYLGGYETWNNVGTVTLTCEENNNQTITHPYFVNNMGGDGYISGYVVEGVAPRKPGEPVRGAGVALEQIPGGSVAFRTTDTTGFFDFPDVPAGNYQLLVNIPGKDLAETYDITITAGINDRDTANIFFVNDTLIYIQDTLLTIDSILSKVQFASDAKFAMSVMPNPAKDITYIVINMENTGTAEIEINSMSGQRVGAVVKAELTEGKHNYVLDINKYNLSSGVYFVSVSTSEGKETKRLIIE